MRLTFWLAPRVASAVVRRRLVYRRLGGARSATAWSGVRDAMILYILFESHLDEEDIARCNTASREPAKSGPDADVSAELFPACIDGRLVVESPVAPNS